MENAKRCGCCGLPVDAALADEGCSWCTCHVCEVCGVDARYMPCNCDPFVDPREVDVEVGGAA